MDDGPDGVPFERRLAEARRTLDDASPASPPDGERPDLRAEGEAAEGRIRAVATTGGHVESLALDPRALRLPPEDLGRETAAALNAALGAVREQAAAQRDAMVADPAVLAERLREVQNEGLRQLSEMTRGINEAFGSVHDKAYVSGEASFTGMEQVLESAGRFTAPPPAEPAPDASTTAEATADDGRVRVVVSTSGRVEEVDVAKAAGRMASHELGDAVVSAANAALAEAAEKATTAVTDDLRRRAQDVQDQSVEQFGSLVRSLADLMNSLQRR